MTREEWAHRWKQNVYEFNCCFCFFIVTAAAHSLWEAYDGFERLYGKCGLIGHDLCQHGDKEYWKNEAMRLGKWLKSHSPKIDVHYYINDYDVPNYYLLFVHLWKSGITCEQDKVWYVFSKYLIANKVYHLLEQDGPSASFISSDVLSLIGIKPTGIEEDKPYVRDAGMLLEILLSQEGKSVAEDTDWLAFLIFADQEDDLYRIANSSTYNNNNDSDNYIFYKIYKSYINNHQTEMEIRIVSACRDVLDNHTLYYLLDNTNIDKCYYFKQAALEIEQGEAYYIYKSPEPTASESKSISEAEDPYNVFKTIFDLKKLYGAIKDMCTKQMPNANGIARKGALIQQKEEWYVFYAVFQELGYFNVNDRNQKNFCLLMNLWFEQDMPKPICKTPAEIFRDIHCYFKNNKCSEWSIEKIQNEVKLPINKGKKFLMIRKELLEKFKSANNFIR